MPATGELLPYEWAVLRVVPRVERGESVNVGVLVYAKQAGFLAALVTDDLSRALALDPTLDAAAVRTQLELVVAVCAGHPSAGANADRPATDRFRWLTAPRSTVVQPSSVHTGLSADPAGDLARLYAAMVVPVAS